MARKDDIFQSFLEHSMFKENYHISKKDKPETVREGLNSSIPIIKAIALIVDSMEAATHTTDTALRNLVIQYLNEAAL